MAFSAEKTICSPFVRLFRPEKGKQKTIERANFSVAISLPKRIPFQTSNPAGKGELFRKLFQHIFPAENIAAGKVYVVTTNHAFSLNCVHWRGLPHSPLPPTLLDNSTLNLGLVGVNEVLWGRNT